MTTRKTAAKAATPAAATSVALVQPEYNRADTVKRLAVANAKERVLILSALPMGEVAALGGIVGTISDSVNEVLNIKMVAKHGADWVALVKALPADLCDADKERRKEINASLEALRATVQANSGGNKDKARDVLRKVKDWGSGKHKNKASNPKANEKRGLQEFLLSWDAMPSTYRRIMKDEEACEADMALADAIAAYFTANRINPRSVLDCSGKSAWNA